MTLKMNLLGFGFEGSEWDASRNGYATRIGSEYQFVKLKGQAQLVWIVVKAASSRPTRDVDVRA